MKRRVKTTEDLVKEAFDYAVNFYSNNHRGLDNQERCLAEMQKMSGFDRAACIKIQNPVMDFFMMNELMEIGDTIAQQHLDIITSNIRQHLLGTQTRLQNEQPKDLSNTSISSRNKKLTEGFTGQVLGGAVHDERHKRDYSEKPQVNKELLNAVRKVDRENNAKAVNFMLFHDHYINDDDMYWMSSIFNTHKDNLAINMLDLSNNGIRLEQDNGLPFFSFNFPYNTPRNIVRLDLSNNSIGDAGAKVVADGLANGVLPITKYVNLSGNKITDTGTVTIAEALKTGRFPVLKQLDVSGNDTSLVTEKFMLDALKHPSTQSVILLLKRSNDLKVVLSGSKEEKQKLVKATLQTAKDNGVDVKNIAVSKGILGFLDNLGYVISDFAIGFTKCNIIPEDAETFAIEAITAKICKKTAAANAAKDAVVCFFDTIDEVSTSPEGVQFIKDLDLLGANTVIDSIE